MQDGAEFPIGKMSDSFFLLAWFQIEIGAAVMILAEFRMERREHFSQRFAMPGHQFRKEKRGNRGVALRQVEVGTDAAAFLAAYQNVLFEHQFAAVFEADEGFREVSAEFRGKLVNEFWYRTSFGHIS